MPEAALDAETKQELRDLGWQTSRRAPRPRDLRHDEIFPVSDSLDDILVDVGEYR